MERVATGADGGRRALAGRRTRGEDARAAGPPRRTRRSRGRCRPARGGAGSARARPARRGAPGLDLTRYLGVDLAWGPRARTGLAALDEHGRLVASAAVRADDEIAAFVSEHAPGEVVAAIDAPLVVPNLTGRRRCEALVTAEFGRFHAGAYPANRSNPLFDPPRARTLADRFGWATDPGVVPGAGTSVAIEVYPHPATILLFGLTTVLPYKARRGRDLESRRPAFRALLDHLERVCDDPLRLSVSPRWAELRAVVAGAVRASELERVEDEIDAVLCAYLAWLWGERDPRMRVLGDADEGYIVVPGTVEPVSGPGVVAVPGEVPASG